MRRFFAYALIGCGVLCATLLSLAINLASNDAQSWLATHTWYDAKLLWTSTGLLIIVGVVLAILQARSEPKQQPATLTIEAGIVEPNCYLNPPKGTTNVDETAILFILDIPRAAIGIVHCLIKIKNTGAQGLSGVRVQLEYPEQYLVNEGTAFILDNDTAFVKPTKEIDQTEKREVVVLEGVARVSYKIDYLRFNETTVIPEPLQFRHALPKGQQPKATTALGERLALKQEFLDYLRLRVFVFAQETYKEEAFDVFAFAGASHENLSGALASIKDAIWNGTPPQPGGYIRIPPPRWRASRLEMSVPQFKIEMPGKLYLERPMEQALLGIVTILLPDVNFRHTNDRPKLGLHILGKDRADPKITILTPKPPTV